MTPWSIELMDITRFWVSSFLMLCQAFSGFHLLFICGPFCLKFSLQQVKCMLNWVKIGWLTWPFKNIPLLRFNKLLGCFGCMFWVIVHLYYETLYYENPINLTAFSWIWADSMSLNTSEFIRLLLSCVTSLINTSVPVPLAAMHAQASHFLCCVLQMSWYALDHELFHTFSILFSCHHPGRGWCWFHLSKECFSRTVLAFFRCFLAKSNPAFLFLRLMSGLHLAVNPLYLLSWGLLFMVDLNIDTPASWRVLFTWLAVVKEFVFTMEMILRSSATVVFRGRPGFSGCTKL